MNSEPASLPLNQSVLFLDDHWVARHTYVWREIHSPIRTGIGPVIVADRPWEARCIIARSVLYDAQRKRYRLWYQTYNPAVRSPECTYLCYAESTDGILWHKPSAGQIPYRGSVDNNIVVGNLGGLEIGSGSFDCPNVVEDPLDPDPQRRFKLLLMGSSRGRSGFFVGFSPDGIQWTMRREPVLTHDEHVWDTNTLFVDRELGRPYICFDRHRRMYEEEHRRCIYRSDSADFESWTKPELCLAPDLADDPGLQYYSMSAFACADVYVGLLQVLHRSFENPCADRQTIRLAVSRDSFHWKPVEPRRDFFSPGPAGSFDAQWMYLPPPVPSPHNGPLLFLYDGRVHSHGCQYPSGAVGAASLRQEAFCSISGGPELEGLLETRPLLLPRGRLCCNAITNHGGAIRAEIVPLEAGAGSAPVQSRSLEKLFQNGELFVPFEWREPVPEELIGKPVALRFWLRAAHLFSCRFSAA